MLQTTLISFIKKSNINESKLDLWLNQYCFKIVLKSSYNSSQSNIVNDQLILVNNHRKNYITKLIKIKMNEIVTSLKSSSTTVSPSIYIKINKNWTTQFLNVLSVIGYSDRSELINAKLFKYYNYNIIIKNEETDEKQSLIDYMGLCWLYYSEKNIASGVELDAVVSKTGFSLFYSMLVGIEFFEELFHYPILYSYYSKNKLLTIQDIQILTDDNFDEILKFPEESVLLSFSKKYISHYPNWRVVPYLN
jgi:hypothetical protein